MLIMNLRCKAIRQNVKKGLRDVVHQLLGKFKTFKRSCRRRLILSLEERCQVCNTLVTIFNSFWSGRVTDNRFR